MHRLGGQHTCIHPQLPGRCHLQPGRAPCRRQHAPYMCRSAFVKAGAAAGTPPFGILLECDGVVIDAHREGHRVAFNRAFSEMGMDSMNWNPSVYHDLLRSGDGSPEGILRAFFNAVGWPTRVPVAARRSFVEEVHDAKRRHLREMMQNREIPLRTGVADFIREALEAGARLGTVTTTASTPDERLHEAALLALGPSLAGQLRVFSLGDTRPGAAEGSGRGDAASAEGGRELSLEAQFSLAQARMKQDEASTFISSLKADSESSVPLGIDPALLVAASRGEGPVSAAFLAACVATMDLPLRRCAVVAANSSVMQAARSAGMVSIAVPAALSARGRFSHADATCDGFGSGGGLTLRRVQTLLSKAEA